MDWRCRASKDERNEPLAGDEILPETVGTMTHAITIETGPEHVWPWIAQMGADRAGWYSHDWIDNGGRSSASKVLPELQDVRPGDVMPALPGAEDAFIVTEVDRPDRLVLTVPGPEGTALVTWAFYLRRLEPDRTRLIVRGRASADWMADAKQQVPWQRGLAGIERVYAILARMPQKLLFLVARFGHGAMQTKQLRGIKERAERPTAPGTAGPPAP